MKRKFLTALPGIYFPAPHVVFDFNDGIGPLNLG